MITLFIRCSLDIILNNVLKTDDRNARGNTLSGIAMLTKTYSKLYYRGGGWFAISGYASDGKDVHRIIDIIKDLKSVAGAVLKEGGYYFNKKGAICGTYDGICSRCQADVRADDPCFVATGTCFDCDELLDPRTA